MKLINPAWECAIQFEENTVNVVTIEDTCLFRETVLNFIKQTNGDEGDFVLSVDNKEISLSKKAEVIFNPFSLDINNKKIISKLYQNLEEEAVSAVSYLETQELLSHIQSYLERISDTIEFPICFDEETNILTLFKLVNLRIEDITISPLEKLAYYIELMQNFCGIDLFIFVNFKIFFTKEEIESFYLELNYRKIKYILLENVCIWRGKQEKNYIIDKDLCQI